MLYMFPGGKESIETLKMQGDAIHFINEAFRHCKPLGATGEGIELLKAANLPDIKFAGQKSADKVVSDKGVVTSRNRRKQGLLMIPLLLQLQNTGTGIGKRKNRFQPETFLRREILLY